jgi:uncharacterized membrane protein YuzA (DUF378 family)
MCKKCIDGAALTIGIIGAINWGLIGLFRFDLVAFLFGEMSWLSRVVYSLVGLSGLYLISFFMNILDPGVDD